MVPRHFLFGSVGDPGILGMRKCVCQRAKFGSGLRRIFLEEKTFRRSESVFRFQSF